MARAEEKLGRVVKARENYLRIVKEQIPATAPPAFRDAQAQAEQELKAIEPRLASLQISVEGGDAAKDLVVLVNGQAVPAALVGVSRPVDPGEYQVEAVGTGFRAPAQVVALGEGQRKAIVLAVAVDASAVPPGGAAAAPASEAATAPPPAATSDTSSGTYDSAAGGGGGLRIASYVALGVGVVGVGLGTYFLIDSSGKRSDADDLEAECIEEGGGVCSPDDPQVPQISDLDDQANGSRTLALVSYGVGGAALATGVILYFMSADEGAEPAPAAGLRVRPWVGLGSAGVYGRF
jgi:hypothetical protein